MKNKGVVKTEVKAQFDSVNPSNSVLLFEILFEEITTTNS